MMPRNNPVLRGSTSIFVGRLARRFASLRGECGSSLVEYAIVFLLLITMLLGIADFSRALYAFHFVSNAAREATRYAAVRGFTCTSDGSCTAPAASGPTGDIQAFVSNVPMGINGSNVTATTTWPVQTKSPSVCSTTATQNSPGCTVQVQVTYKFNFFFPFVSKSTLTMNSTSEMIITH
jgi:Flp pilus assembly protein TadG